MLILIIFAFIAGFVTILSPCILPILPVVLSGSVSQGKRRPLGIVTGFITSFTFFTLFLSSIVKLTGVSADSLRTLSVITIFLLGISLLYPKLQAYIEQAFSLITKFAPRSNTQSGFNGGLITGFSLGLVWTPCVGPILASVISLALSGEVSSAAFIITLSYSLGTAIPMLVITYTGQHLFQKIPWLLSKLARIQQWFGVFMILTSIGIYTNLDRKFQTLILNQFPQYGAGLTNFENNQTIQNQLDKLRGKSPSNINTGRPMFESDPNNYPQAPEIIPGGQWFNSDILTIKQLRGKVILVDFWTYSCINCIRTLPYLKSWHAKYSDKGLVILGVHSPEFAFEKNPDNLAQAIKDFDLGYPIVQDNDFNTWRNYQNRYWPAKYLVDKNGRIRYTHFGEGKYDETEQMIQQLLSETGQSVSDIKVDNQQYQTYARTPELYLGYNRIQAFSSPEKISPNKPNNYSIPTNLGKNTFAYSGNWTVADEFSQSSPQAQLQLDFNAKDVYLVMNPVDDQETSVNVYLDGNLVTNKTAGKDVNQGIVSVSENRLYHLISLPESGHHLLKLEYPSGNIQVFAFTFG